MCNLYRLKRARAEIAHWFGKPVREGANFASEVYPGYPGLVATREDVRAMVWGFPLVLKGKSGQPLKPKPVNNARTDKLSTPFWRSSMDGRRCLIPVSAFAEAEGPRGAMTRTWISLPGEDLFACAGIWRDSAEWGEVFSMVMTEASPAMAGIHDRMPVILDRRLHDTWLAGATSEAVALCRPFAGELDLHRTAESWAKR